MSPVDQLVEEHLAWASKAAERFHRHVPPSFALDDLEQSAYIGLWKAAKRYDDTRNVTFRAFARTWVRGEMSMMIRRKNYAHATTAELPVTEVDSRPRADASMLIREAWENRERHKQKRRRAWVNSALAKLTGTQAYLIRRVYLEGQDPKMLADAWNVETGEISRRLSVAVRKLKSLRRKK